MRLIRTVLPVLALSALCTAAADPAAAQQNSQQVTVPYTDPSRPGALRVNLMQGGVTIRGTNRKDVLIEGQASDEVRRDRDRDNDVNSTGLRRLTQAGGWSVQENNNQVSVTSGMNRGTDFVIQVPSRTNLKLSTLNNGPIVVENVEGEIEINNQNSTITLTNVAGSVVANAHNGKVKVTMTRVTADKAMAFTSFNGDVDVTLPASTKANLKMRSDMGEIFTGFDMQTIAPPPVQNTRTSDGRIRINVNQTIQGTINGGGPEFELRTFNGSIYVRKGQ